MAAEVGEAIIKLTFDGKSVKASLNKTESEIESSGKSSGTAWGNAWTVAAGNLIAKGISKIANSISNSLSKAINRVDIINNFPRVMTSLGYASEEASGSIDELSTHLLGLPTSLQDGVTGVQKLASTMGNLNQGVVNATSLGLALNDMFLAGGQGAEGAARALEQYNQMLANGKVDMQSWRTVNEVASGQLRQLAQTFLGAEANAMDLYKALQEGSITFDQMNEAIVRLDKEGGEGFANWEEQARAATGGIGTTIENLYNRLAAAIGKIIEHIGPERIAGVIDSISTSFSGFADVVINIIDFLSQNQWVLDAIMAFFVGLLGMGIATKVMSFFTMLSTFAATNPVLLAIGAISAALFLIMTHLDEVGQFFQDVFGGIADFLGGICETIGGFFTGLWEGFKSGVQGAWDFITGIFGKLADFFGSIFSNAWNAVKNVFSTGGKIFMGIVDGITNAFKAIVNAIITGINHVVALPFNAINGFLSFLKSIDILGIKPFGWVGTIDVPQIPLLAQGGYANGATGAVIGESGSEVVLPLEQNTDNWAGLLAQTLADEMEEQGTIGNVNVYIRQKINSHTARNADALTVYDTADKIYNRVLLFCKLKSNIRARSGDCHMLVGNHFRKSLIF